ncbi:hypothetical protein [Paraburkholderia ginsengiterrae]|uniref:hypothetical protein n=1 Tax=Paraburkholderia ginsengiterrae TaxID=1462993 RepID=UPI0009EF4257|nr:hypothetical protein [Paraburkholderia ginsengiterrae]
MKRFFQHLTTTGAICIALATSALAQSNNEVVTAVYEGTLGSQRIGMTLIVKDGQLIPDSHYFYNKHLTDIPLTGTAGRSLTLKEPGGGTFTLHFEGNGSNGNAPLAFENSIGLSGSWTGPDSKTYPVALAGGGGPGPAAPPDTRRYQDVTDKSDTAFEAQAQGFYKAVLTGDRAAAARYVSFPLRVNFSPTRHVQIKTPTELNAQWSKIFNAAWLKKAADAAPHDMPVIRGQAMLGNGLAFFGSSGAEVINAGS